MRHLIIERPEDFAILKDYSGSGSFCVALTESAPVAIPASCQRERTITTLAQSAEGDISFPLSGGLALLAQMVGEENSLHYTIIDFLTGASRRRRIIDAAAALDRSEERRVGKEC